MKSITALPKLQGARVIIRVDYNVPIVGGKIKDARRIEASYETIDAVIRKGGTPVLVTHLGDSKASVRPIAAFLSKKYKIVLVANDIFNARTLSILNEVPKGTLVLLENIRRYAGEEENDKKLAKALAVLGSYYVNDAFSVSHRRHASVVGVPKLLPSFAGKQLEREIKTLAPIVSKPAHPFLFILGGAKVGTKIPLLKKFLDVADQIVIAGAILNNFYKVSGMEVGGSVTEDGFDKEIKKLLKSPNVLLPIDVIVLRSGKKTTIACDDVQSGDVIVDIGPRSVSLISEKIAKAKLIVWNGPTGWYEKGFTKATTQLATVIGTSKAKAVIGGGDTGAVLDKIADGKKNIFVSTGGGATLDFLVSGSLPGIQELK